MSKRQMVTLGLLAGFIGLVVFDLPTAQRWLDAMKNSLVNDLNLFFVGLASFCVPVALWIGLDPRFNVRLGPEGAGMSLSTCFMERERCTILAGQVGAMQRQLEVSIEFAKNREQFGKSIGKYQSVANRIVDMKVRQETARLLLYKTV